MQLTFLVAALRKQKETGINPIHPKCFINIKLLAKYFRTFKIKSLKLGICFIVLEHLSLGEVYFKCSVAISVLCLLD